MARRYYSSTAVATTLSGNINNSTTSITVAALSGYPAQTPFTAIIDPDTASEEVVEVTNVSGTTLTVTRGVDGTTASSHNAGAVFRHGVSARDFDEANAHVNDTTTNPHNVTATQVGAVANALIDAAGDLLVGSADNTVGRLGLGSNGQVLTVDTAGSGVAKVKWADAAGGAMQITQQIITSGSTWTPPAGVTRLLTVVCIGAGGGGGSGAREASSVEGAGGGAGGGSGATSTFHNIDVSSSPVSISIGAGGSGGAAATGTPVNGSAGTSGGTTWFGSSAYSAGGGGGGSAGARTAVTVSGGSGGSSVNLGAGAAGGAGAETTTPGSGAQQSVLTTSAPRSASGGGGGGTETLNRYGSGGGAGSASSGGTAGANDQTTNANINGATASASGCGGGGGGGTVNNAGNPSGAGGSGANGAIYVYYLEAV